MDYALFISLALYGAYVVAVAGSPRQEGRARGMVVALLAAILLYAGLKYTFTPVGIQ